MSEPRRLVAARWTFTAILEMQSAFQIGSQESDYCDETFAVNSAGKLFLPGTTLAGALRSALSDRLAGYRNDEPNEVKELFGFLRTAGDPQTEVPERESPLIVFDAVAINQTGNTVRDSVRIDPLTGVASEGFKYDRELSLPGVRFPIRIDLLVPNKGVEARMLTNLITALDCLEAGDIRLGARKTRGLGECIVRDCRAFRYNLTSRQGWLDYANSDYETPLRSICKADTFRQAIHESLKTDLCLQKQLHASSGDKRERLRIELALKVRGTLLIRSSGDGCDANHLTEDGKRVLSGTSLAGVLRAQAQRILKTLNHTDPLQFLDRLFGPSPGNLHAGGVPRASRVYVSEAFLEGTRAFRQTRVKIDRFTGGTVEGALFTEEPVAGGDVMIELEVRAPRDSEIGLLLLLTRDLSEGLVPIGSGANVGRGRLFGEARIAVPGEMQLLPTFGDGCPCERAGFLQSYVDSILLECEVAE